MGILEDLIGGGAPVTPGLLDAAGYMDPAQYDRARRSSAMDGLWAGLLAGGAPSLTPRNFFSALGTGMQGRQQYGSDFDKDQLASSQAAAQRALIPQRQLELEQKRDALKLVTEKLPQLVPGYGGAGGGAAGAAPGAGGGGGSGGGGGREVASMTADSTLPPEARGLLDTIAGPESAGAYNIRYTPKGGATFDGYDAHPRIPEPGPQGPSTAAGRYQIVASTFDPLAVKYGFKDFKPETQDQAAWHLAQDTYRQKTGGDLLADLQAGKTDRVQSALSGQWATLRMDNFGANVEKYRRASAVAANEIPDVGTRSLDQANLPSIRAPGDPRVSQAFPEVPSYAGALGEPVAPVPGAVAGAPRPAPAPGLTVLGAPVDRAYQLNAMTPQQQHEANLAAGGRGIFPPGQKFNRNGSPISADLTATLPGQQSGPNIPPEVARSLGRRADAGGPDTVVAAGPLPPVPGLPGGPAAAGGSAAMQLAALVSGGAGGQLRPGAAPGGGDTVVPSGPLPAAPATPAPAPAPAATQPPAGTLVPGAMPTMPTPADQTIVPRPDLAPQPGLPERPTLTPAPAARPLPALPPAPGLTAPDFSQVGQAVPADVARRAGIALQVGLGLKILGLDVPAISKIAELPLELQKTAYEAAVKAPYELRNTQYQSLLNMNTEQWKNLSENDRTLWSAALGLDKTEFEARIRQSEKGVEEQNKQINQNWANMTDAEKAKAAASNQFANTKFQAEMEQYGKWNSPTEVKEYDPVTGDVRVRTSTPAMEYQREIARTGGPQGLTVGQALQTPGAQQGPAPAPGATQPPPGAPTQTFAPPPVPGAAPIPLRPGGAFIRGEPGAGSVEETRAAAAELGKLRVQYQKDADQARTNISDLDVMLSAAPQVALKGPLAGYAQGVNRIINSLTGEQRDRVAANELVTKNSERLIRDTVRQSDSQPAAIQLSMTRNSMPTTGTSNQGFYETVGQMRGAQEWMRYRSDMTRAYTGVTRTMDGFTDWLPVSPHAFMLMNMPKEYVDRMEKQLIDNGRRDEARALHSQLDLARQWRASKGL